MSDKSYVYHFEPSPAVRAGLAVAAGLLCAAGTLFCTTSLQLAIWAAIILETLVWTICDISARLLPTNLTIVFTLTAAVWQLSIGGVEALGRAVGLAAICIAVFGGLSLVSKLVGNRWAFGAGDMKLVGPVGLACGYPGMFAGFGGLVITSALWFIYLAMRKELARDATLPFGPMLAATAVLGCAGGAAAAAGLWSI